MNRTAARRTRWQILSQILSWIASLAALGSGIALFLYGKSISVSSSVGANEGTITDASEYYHKATAGSSSITLGSTLIAVGILGIIIVLVVFAHPWVTTGGESSAVSPDAELNEVLGEAEDVAVATPDEISTSGAAIVDVKVPDLAEQTEQTSSAAAKGDSTVGSGVAGAATTD